MKNKLDLYFDLIIILLIWLSWLFAIDLIQVNQVIFYYKPYPEKIILSTKDIFYIFPIALTIFIVYNFILRFFSLKNKILDIVNF